MALFAGGTFAYGMSAFFVSLAEEFKWSQAAIGLAFGIRSLESGLAAPLFGVLVDRYGPRRLLFFGMLTAGIGFLLFSRINSLPTFYLTFFLMALGWTPVFSVVSVVAVARWFRKRVSLALGLLAVGTGAGSILLPAVVWLVTDFGWRRASFILGLAVLAICVPLTFVVRDRPEDMGQRPYGAEGTGEPATPEEVRDGQLRGVGDGEYTIGRALRQRDFWFITLVFTATFAMANAVVTFHIPFLLQLDISVATAAWVLSISGIASVTGRAVMGWLGDIADKRYLIAGVIGVQIIALLSLATAHSLGQVMVYGVAFGLGWGGSIPLRNAIVVEHFGRKATGTIQGFSFGISTMISFLSPVFVGRMFDLTGDYRTAYLILAAFLMVTGPLILLVQRQPLGAAPRA
ncbi:MAG: MFS transporter [Dehalococcoidia bacterium]